MATRKKTTRKKATVRKKSTVRKKASKSATTTKAVDGEGVRAARVQPRKKTKHRTVDKKGRRLSPPRSLRGDGAPSLYTTELGEEIALRLGAGESLRSVCRDPYMPEPETVWRWLRPDEAGGIAEFRKQYARGRELQSETFVDQIVEIADDDSNDTIVDKDGRIHSDHKRVHRDRLKVDARKWVASRILPKKYGDRLEVDNPSAGAQLPERDFQPDADYYSKLCELLEMRGAKHLNGRGNGRAH